jgi:signal transduction histidine kinase
MKRHRRGRFGFRPRLSLSIAVTFILLGSTLVGVQYLLLSQSFNSVLTFGSGSGAQGGPFDATFTIDPECADGSGSTNCVVSSGDELVNYGNEVAQQVMGRYLGWSVVLLAVFMLLGAVLAWWLTRSPAHTIAGISSLAREITEHDLSKRLELSGPRDEITELGDRIDDMLERLQHAFTAQGQFAANASHELRTPVTTMRAALEAPLSQGRVPDDLVPSLQRALRANQRMDELITALLLLAKTRHLDASRFTDVDLLGIIRQGIEDVSEQAAARGITITSDLPDKCNLRADASALPIAIRNLLSNAVQHNHDAGEVHAKVTVEAGAPVFVVSNTGQKYSVNEVDELLRPFNRGSDTRLAGASGSGLGLSIVQAVTQAHSATLAISPRPDGGVTISLTFPVPSKSS